MHSKQITQAEDGAVGGFYFSDGDGTDKYPLSIANLAYAIAGGIRVVLQGDSILRVHLDLELGFLTLASVLNHAKSDASTR